MIPSQIKEYREGFLGGGSCALAFSTMYPGTPVWVNDLYYNLYCFWTQLQNNSDSLTNRILELKDKACVATDVTELEQKHRDLYGEMRELINTSTDPHDLATAFYVLNRVVLGDLQNRIRMRLFVTLIRTQSSIRLRLKNYRRFHLLYNHGGLRMGTIGI